jgi:hypothetical protein
MLLLIIVERKELMMITVFAENGGLTLNGDNGCLAQNIKTAKTLSYYLEKFNIADQDVYFSSSMDFAADEGSGFETDDGAKILWEEGVVRYNRISR